ncbi:nuclear transcription factor Y subunit beta-like [Sycon ciliatum]|uniref:nuclear transcription factor Y subunit beta-like n=1 Tax=Sycon ciliatum TaxID=27933 RepID=UPI0031F5F2CF
MYLTGTCHVPVGTGDDEENAENSGTLSRRVSSDTEQAGTPTPPVAHGSESNHVDGEQPPPQDQFAERLQPTQEQREQQGKRQLEQHFQRSAERHDPRPEEQHDPRPEEQHDPRPEEQHSPRSAEQHNHSAEQQHDPRSAGQHNHSAEQQHNPRSDDQQVERHHTLQRQLSFVMTAGLFRFR